MNKKAYQQPRLHTVNIEQQPLLQDSITSVSGNAGLKSSISAGSISQARLFFGDGEQAAIEQIAERPSSNSQSGLYSLDGRKLVGMPTARSAEGRLLPKGLKKGIYVINGKKVVIK